MIKIKSYDLKSILILSIFIIASIIGMIMIFLSKDSNEQVAVPVGIILGCIVFFAVLQVIIFLFTFKKVSIDHNGISVYEKSNKKTILWSEVKLYTYYNEMIILEPRTLKILYGDNEMLLGQDYSTIHVSLKKYKESIHYIPEEIIKSNDLFLYETVYLYKRDKYKLYKNMN